MVNQSFARLGKNVFEILSRQPKHGVGSRLSRNTWKDDSFWTVSDVKLSLDGKHGKAYGVLTWRGEAPAEGEQRAVAVAGPLKKVWRRLPEEGEAARQPRWESGAAAALRQEAAAAAAASSPAEEPAEEAAAAAAQ